MPKVALNSAGLEDRIFHVTKTGRREGLWWEWPRGSGAAGIWEVEHEHKVVLRSAGLDKELLHRFLGVAFPSLNPHSDSYYVIVYNGSSDELRGFTCVTYGALFTVVECGEVADAPRLDCPDIAVIKTENSISAIGAGMVLHCIRA